MTNSRIAIANTPEEIRRCHPVMHELRTHIAGEQEFVDRVQRQQREGYQLAFSNRAAKFAALPAIVFSNRSFPAEIFTSTIWSRARPTVRAASAANYSIG